MSLTGTFKTVAISKEFPGYKVTPFFIPFLIFLFSFLIYIE